METIYYYKTISDTWHFSTGVSRDASKAVEYMRMLRQKKTNVRRLYLDIPEDFEMIKRLYRTPEYWSKRTWKDEYNEE